MMLPPPPRAWVDWTVPTDEQGEEIGVASTSESYRFYLRWLADYLYQTDIPVPECQEAMVERYSSEDGAESAVFDLGDTMGILLDDMESLERRSLEGTSWETIHAEEMGFCGEYSEEERETITEEDFCVSQEDYERISREAKESRKMPSHIKHADIPFRAVFASLLKEVHEPEERYRLLDRFYYNLNESASK